MSPLRYLPLVILLAAVPAVAGDLVVAVSSHAGIDRLTQDEVINIYMGRYRRLPNGAAAIPIDQPEVGDLKSEFYRRLVNKSLSDIHAYWARLVFSGRTSPPRQAESSVETLRQLASLPGAVAYLERNQVDSRFRVVLELPDNH
jgi:hypothetical protein